jgi:hypothetical protein
MTRIGVRSLALIAALACQTAAIGSVQAASSNPAASGPDSKGLTWNQCASLSDPAQRRKCIRQHDRNTGDSSTAGANVRQRTGGSHGGPN